MDLFYILSSNDFCSSEAGYRVFGFVGIILNIIQIAIPIILILWGSIDLLKAIMSSDESSIKKAQGLLIKRAIYGVVIFFIPMLVKFIMGMVGGDELTNNACMYCFSNGSECLEKAKNMNTEDSFDYIEEDSQYEYCSGLNQTECVNSENCSYETDYSGNNVCVPIIDIDWSAE